MPCKNPRKCNVDLLQATKLREITTRIHIERGVTAYGEEEASSVHWGWGA